jgi:hypothetical protein
MKIFLGILLFLSLCALDVQTEWTMYPNPAKDHLIVEIKEGKVPKYIKIYDMNGRLMQIEPTWGRNTVRFYLHLKRGSYVVNLEDK